MINTAKNKTRERKREREIQEPKPDEEKFYEPDSRGINKHFRVYEEHPSQGMLIDESWVAVLLIRVFSMIQDSGFPKFYYHILIC
jgi:hypothetical protein